MNVNVKVDEEFISTVVEEYCSNRPCPNNCFFDLCGFCTVEKPFNVMLDEYKEWRKLNEK